MRWAGRDRRPRAGAEGEVVTANLFDIEEEVKHASRLSGKVVLVVMQGEPKKSGDVLFAIFGDFLKAAGKAGAVAVIGGQGGAKAYWNELDAHGDSRLRRRFAIPGVIDDGEDQGQLERYVESGKKGACAT